MRKRLLMAAIVVAIAGLAPAGTATALTIKQGQNLPLPTLTDGKGKKVPLSSVVGMRVTVLVYWSVTCAHCVETIPVLLKRYNERQKPYRLVLIAGDTPAMMPVAKCFLPKKKLGRAVALFDEAAKKKALFGDTIGLEYTPTVIIVGRDGKVKKIFEGMPSYNDFDKAIKNIVGG